MWAMYTRAVKETPLLSECAFSVCQNPQDVLAYYGQLRAYVQHEDGLINSRLTWSLTIHGFLFALFGIITGKSVDLLAALHEHPTVKSPDPLASGILPIWGVLATVSLVGLLVGYFSREAIVGAHNALQHLSVIAHRSGPLQIPPPLTESADPTSTGASTTQFGSARLPRIIGGGAALEHTVSASQFYLWLPVVMMIAWVSLFVLVSLFLDVQLRHLP